MPSMILLNSNKFFMDKRHKHDFITVTCSLNSVRSSPHKSCFGCFGTAIEEHNTPAHHKVNQLNTWLYDSSAFSLLYLLEVIRNKSYGDYCLLQRFFCLQASARAFWFHLVRPYVRPDVPLIPTLAVGQRTVRAGESIHLPTWTNPQRRTTPFKCKNGRIRRVGKSVMQMLLQRHQITAGAVCYTRNIRKQWKTQKYSSFRIPIGSMQYNHTLT